MPASQQLDAPGGMSGGIDIIFASFNGARTLARMLASLKQLKRPKRPWRILAVDNASSDQTAAILSQASADLPLTLLSCAEPGKVPALKLAASQVRGDLVVFTDDDVEPDPAWLRAYEAAADFAPARVGLFGGPIRPTLIEAAGPWYEACARYHAELFARSDAGEGAVEAEQAIFGPNFMIRAAHLDVLEAIAPGLGPVHTPGKMRSFAMGEDSMMMAALARRGVDAHYVRAASVRHLVRGFQTELPFMLERAVRHGRGAAIRDVELGGRAMKRRMRIVLQNAAAALARSPAPDAPSAEAFDQLWRAHWARGAVKGALFGPYPPLAGK